MNIQTLLAEHDRFILLLDTASSCADTGDADAFLNQRIDLAEALTRYLAIEERAIHETQCKPLPSEPAEALNDLLRQTGDLLALWEDHLREWERDAILSDRDCFRSSTAAMFQRLRKRCRQAMDLLCPSAVRNGAIQLRAA